MQTTDALSAGMASDEDRARVRAQQEANAKTACLVTILNPGKRAQVIYDGIANNAPIHFAPKETKTVKLAEHMVVRLQDDEHARQLGSDGKPLIEDDNDNLRVLDWQPAPPDVAAASQPPRKPRPPAKRPAAA